MTYVTEQMRAALAEHRLRQVCNSNGVRVFRMAKPGTALQDIHLVFLPERIFLGSLGWTGASNGRLQCTLAWFVNERDERRLCEAFSGPDGWLCVIQQRFAELYREREARIEAIVGAWEWGGIPLLFAGNPGVSPFDRGPPVVASLGPDSEGECRAWETFSSAGKGERGEADSFDAAKEAACAAVLRQAKERPELWHCGEVDT